MPGNLDTLDQAAGYVQLLLLLKSSRKEVCCVQVRHQIKIHMKQI